MAANTNMLTYSETDLAAGDKWNGIIDRWTLKRMECFANQLDKQKKIYISRALGYV